MTDSELNKRILQGESLFCVMQPDDVIPANAPLHDEHFRLPHVIISGDGIIAMTLENVHIRNFEHLMYYTNFELFGSYCSTQDRTGIQFKANGDVSSMKRYKKHDFLTRNDFEILWDSQENCDVSRLRKAIAEYRDLRVAFTDEDGIWNIHPVVRSSIEKASDNFLLQTMMIHYPIVFRDFAAFRQALEQSNEYFNSSQIFERMNNFMCQSFNAYYQLKKDGTYRSAYDIIRGTTHHEYGHLKVFGRKKYHKTSSIKLNGRG